MFVQQTGSENRILLLLVAEIRNMEQARSPPKPLSKFAIHGTNSLDAATSLTDSSWLSVKFGVFRTYLSNESIQNLTVKTTQFTI